MTHRTRRMWIALFALALGVTALASAQPAGPEQALERLFTADSLAAEWFAQPFLDQIPVEQIEAFLDQVTAELGAFQRVEPEGDRYRVVFEDGVVPTLVSLDEAGRIQGLRLLPVVTTAVDLDAAVQAFRDLQGTVSVLVTRDGEAVASFEAGETLAVGSTFKLAVLAALRGGIASGELAWDDVVHLREGWRSLPTGILQDWPEGAAVTLETLASLMISRSDNTATDALVHIVGRNAIEGLPEVGVDTLPFLTTREAFVLKAPANDDLRESYLEGGLDERRAVLERTEARVLPAGDVFGGEPLALEIEWFFSTEQLCELMSQVEDLRLMGINPGVANPSHWSDVAFKGGSEPGVLNLTTWLETAGGPAFCVSATWNRDVALDEARFQGLYGGLLEVLQAP